MAIDKQYVLDDNGVGKLAEEIFSTIADNYIRLGYQIDSGINPNSTNPVQNSAVRSALAGKIDLIYGFELDMDESDPSSMIRYFGVNSLYTPAHMDFTRNVFDYGDWKNAWFIKGLRPCILNQDGSVYCYLDPRNYAYKCTWKADGTFTRSSSAASIIADTSGTYNVMVGIPTVWIKVDTSFSSKPRFYFAPTQLDSDYHAYAHTNADGDVVPYIYLAAYEGWKDTSDRMRSISGQIPTASERFRDQLTQCRANNSNSDNIWDMQCLADRELITLLLLLIGRSTNAQTTFGYGNGSGYTNPATNAGTNGILPTGTMNNKGLFYGKSVSSANNEAVKVLGIENFWGNINEMILGLINVNGTIRYKLTKGIQDGSGASDYAIKNNDGTYNYNTGAYFSLGTNSGANLGAAGLYIPDMYVGKYGLIPKGSSNVIGNASVLYCDGAWIDTTKTTIAICGGSSYNGDRCGIFCINLMNEDTESSSNWSYGSTISCKPHLAN